jgi:homoserine O-succinyltransferase
MPVIATDNAPVFERVKRCGAPVIQEKRAENQNIRPLDILVVNQMPDAALAATERQIVDILAFASGVAQIKVKFTSPPNVARASSLSEHIDKHYVPFDRAMDQRVDALIITGANTDKPYTDAEFWKPITDIFEWGQKNVSSTITFCAATLAVGTLNHGMNPQKFPGKLWGVFSHYVTDKKNPLVANMNTKMDVPHSRFSYFDPHDIRAKGARILIESPEAGVHMLTDQTGFKWVGFLGHGEYNTESLHLEARRDMQNYLVDKKGAFRIPRNYYSAHTEKLIHEFSRKANPDIGRADVARFYKDFEDGLDNTWRDSNLRIFQSWVNAVYQLTDYEHKQQYMNHPELDQDNPLAFLSL